MSTGTSPSTSPSGFTRKEPVGLSRKGVAMA